jgi:hypothetical protein
MMQLAAAKEEDDATSKLVDQQPPPSAPANQGQGHVQGGQDMKLEPGEEAVSIAVAQQQPPLGQGVLVNGGLVPAPTSAAAVFHDQVWFISHICPDTILLKLKFESILVGSLRCLSLYLLRTFMGGGF